MARNDCGHQNVEMTGEDGHCTACGRVVGTYDPDWRWFPGEDPSEIHPNRLAIRVLCADRTTKKVGR